MSTKYHINPNTGVVGECRAQTLESCAYSTGENIAAHYEDIRTATKASEAMLKEKYGSHLSGNKKKTDKPKYAKEEWDHDNMHSSEKTLINALNNGKKAESFSHVSHTVVSAGKINPITLTGTGSEYYDKLSGKQSLVILSNLDGYGKDTVAISGFDESLEGNPSDSLGQQSSLIKQNTNRTTEKGGLAIVGYISCDGEVYGYVPSKQVPMYVYK